MSFDSMSLTALREFVAANNIVVEGDKRRKATYISAITAWQALAEAKSEIHEAIAPTKLKAEVILTSPTAIKVAVTSWNGAWQILELLLLGFVVVFWLGRKFGVYYADVIRPQLPGLLSAAREYFLGRNVVDGDSNNRGNSPEVLRAQPD